MQQENNHQPKVSDGRISTALLFLRFLKHRKRYWLLPIVVVLLLLGLLLIVAQGSVVAPFIYPLF